MTASQRRPSLNLMSEMMERHRRTDVALSSSNQQLSDTSPNIPKRSTDSFEDRDKIDGLSLKVVGPPPLVFSPTLSVSPCSSEKTASRCSSPSPSLPRMVQQGKIPGVLDESTSPIGCTSRSCLSNFANGREYRSPGGTLRLSARTDSLKRAGMSRSNSNRPTLPKPCQPSLRICQPPFSSNEDDNNYQ